MGDDWETVRNSDILRRWLGNVRNSGFWLLPEGIGDD